jgi:type IV secretion system protein VirD4
VPYPSNTFLLLQELIRRVHHFEGGSLGYQPQLGDPWVVVAKLPLYPPPAFFWWWFSFDAYAPRIFFEGAIIAASGGFTAIIGAIAMSV